MMTPAQTKQIKEVVKPMRTIVENCTRLMNQRKNSMVGNNSLIEMPGNLYIVMKTKYNGELKLWQCVSIDVTPDPSKASHFTPQDALSVAADCVNGGGQCGNVVTWRTACELTIERYEDAIKFVIDESKEAAKKANKKLH